MATIRIPGITPETVENTSTEARAGGGRPFPCDATSYTKHTATVTSASVKTFTMADGTAKDNLSINIENDGHAGEILLSLDPTDVGGFVKDREAAIQKNLETLTMAIKILGAFNAKGEVDLDKLERSKGQVVKISAKHLGFRDGNKNKFKHNGENKRPGGPRYEGGTLYHDVKIFLEGTAAELTPVPLFPLPDFPSTAGAAAPAPNPDDVPF